jgi:hypothetical protein
VQSPSKARACLGNTICRVIYRNAPPDQNHPATVRRAARHASGTVEAGEIEVLDDERGQVL